MKWNKRGVIDQLAPVIISLVTIAVILVVGFLIMGQADVQLNALESTDTSGGFGENASEDVQDAMDDIPQWLPIIIITIIGALLIGLVGVFKRGLN